MPSGGGFINNLNGITFNKGFMFGTQEGGQTRGIRFGGMQNINLSHTWGEVEAKGPESLSPLGVGITEETLSGTAEFLTIFAAHAAMLLGADVSYDAATNTTLVRKRTNAEPVPFDLRLETPASYNDTVSTDFKVDLYRCFAPTYNIFKAGTRTWGISDFAFRAYGKVINGVSVLFDMRLPGNQTDSSSGAGVPIYPTGATGL